MDNTRKLSLKNILRPAMLLLYFLNTADLLFTKFLLGTGLFFEANPILSLAMRSFGAVFTLKILLPALLLCYLDRRTLNANPKTVKVVFWAVSGLSFIFILVIALHIFLLCISGYFI